MRDIRDWDYKITITKYVQLGLVIVYIIRREYRGTVKLFGLSSSGYIINVS